MKKKKISKEIEGIRVTFFPGFRYFLIAFLVQAREFFICQSLGIGALEGLQKGIDPTHKLLNSFWHGEIRPSWDRFRKIFGAD